eukprot:1156166-Pelagomonas_calceolata.AAC.6
MRQICKGEWSAVGMKQARALDVVAHLQQHTRQTCRGESVVSWVAAGMKRARALDVVARQQLDKAALLKAAVLGRDAHPACLVKTNQARVQDVFAHLSSRTRRTHMAQEKESFGLFGRHGTHKKNAHGSRQA